MENEKFLEQIDRHFHTHDSQHDIALETWTNGGVNMFVVIYKDNEESYFTQFKKYAETLNVDELVDEHRSDDKYKQAFTITEGLADFTAYKEKLLSIVRELENLSKLAPGHYRHYKGGIYEVIGVGKHTENREELVAYIDEDNVYHFRPLEMWFEDVVVDGETVARFTYIEEDSDL